MKIRPVAGAMETVREGDERTTSTPVTRPSRMRFPGRGGCGVLSPLMRSWWMRLLCVLCAASMVVVVGVVVYQNSLSNKRQELKLKCENRVEVSAWFHLLG